MSENSMNSVNSQNDEIDIFELLGRIWKGKFIVLGVMFACFALSTLYTMIATPYYKANARISVPFFTISTENGIKKELFADADIFINKIQSKYIDALKNQPKESAFVEKIAPAKISGTKSNLEDFFDIEVMGKSNDEAIALINKIVREEQEIYKENIDLQRKNTENSIEILQNNIKKLQNQVWQFEEVLLPTKDKEIAGLKKAIDPRQKNDYKNFIEFIPELEKEIQSIEKELKDGNLSQDSLITLKNLLVNLKDRNVIEQEINNDLNGNKFIEAAIAQNEKEELSARLGEIKSQITEQEGKLTFLKGSLTKLNLDNVAIKDDIIVTSQSPAKPKKLLIIAIATFLGGVLGVFWVLIRSEIQKIKQKISEK